MAIAALDDVISHWSRLLENLQASPLEFYSSVETAIKRREIPGAEHSRIDWNEGGVFSAKREYLRVTRGRYVFDLCGAPFGTGFFVSSWLASPKSGFWPVALLVLLFLVNATWGAFAQIFGFWAGTFLFVAGFPFLFWLGVRFMNKQKEGWDDAIVAIPFLGPLYERLFRPQTYYKIDTVLMFQTAVHSALMEAIDEMTSQKGVRALSELERKPILIGLDGKR